MSRYLFLSYFVLIFLSACESQPTRDGDGLINIIPTKEKDSGPSKPVDVSKVPNAVPKVEQRTIAGNKSPYKVKGVVYHVLNDGLGYQAEGIASWYGRKFHGNTTSNGEVYNMYEMTGAHKTLPIPSYVRVENLENNKSIIVRINDRGPFAHGRIIDLSYAGAQKLGYSQAGTAKVRVTYIDVGSNTLSEGISVGAQRENKSIVAESVDSNHELFLQTGAFKSHVSALEEKQSVEKFTTWPVLLESARDAKGEELHRVHIGPLPNQKTLERVQRELLANGLKQAVRVFKPI